jgi:hypothetical protein
MTRQGEPEPTLTHASAAEPASGTETQLNPSAAAVVVDE